MKTRTVVVVFAALVAGAGTLVGGISAESRAALRGVPPRPPASDFSASVVNRWFPLRPGTRYVYTGVKDGQLSRDVFTVTHATRTIDGVPCAAVHDRLYLRGRLAERTTDWYSEDSRGNVWYFGEDTAELDKHGKVTSRQGSWTAGVDGAQAGIYMSAHPRVGQSYQQELYAGQAEDHFKVVGRFGTVAGPAAQNVVVTQEWSPLEPGTIDHKLYVRGIGVVLEQTERGGDERNELVSVGRF
jgi:hypothetical protein